jgi:uncharacterized BrkB/YihY/UPF0761 family membrane protein
MKESKKSMDWSGLGWAYFWTVLLFCFYRYIPPVNKAINQLNPCAKVQAEGNYFKGLK